MLEVKFWIPTFISLASLIFLLGASAHSKNSDETQPAADDSISIQFEKPILRADVFVLKLDRSDPLMFVDVQGHPVKPEDIASLAAEMAKNQQATFALMIPARADISASVLLKALKAFAGTHAKVILVAEK